MLTEKDMPKFKKWLKSHLSYGPVTVTFTKKDGTERVMKCTTAAPLVPDPIPTPNFNLLETPKKERKKNDDIMNVYDLENAAWKSFRWDSIKSIMFTIGEEIEHSNEAQ